MNVQQLTELEFARQRDTLNLIASENYPSPAVLDILGSVWSNKYGEGYPGKRYYAGNQYTDELELYVQSLALQVFDPTGEYAVNLQVLSGSPANAMVFMSVLEPADTVMSLGLADGGHLSHMHKTSAWNKFFKHVNYQVKEALPDTFEIDEADFATKLDEYKPKLVIIGFSAYPLAYEFEKLVAMAHESGALVLADIAHINGLVAAGLHDSPFKSGKAGADFISMTTHKTMRGPRGAMLFMRKEFEEAINKTVFPGTSGGPHFHQMAAIGRALEEIIGMEKYPDYVSFAEYSQNILTNTKALENGLREGGLEIISPTQTHLCLVKLPDDLDSLVVQRSLESQGVICNRNQIPFDTKSPWRPSGLRLGMAALTSRGMVEKDSHNLGVAIADHILHSKSIDTKLFLEKLSWWYDDTNPQT